AAHRGSERRARAGDVSAGKQRTCAFGARDAGRSVGRPMKAARRDFMVLLVLLSIAPELRALGRKPYGGVVRMKLPWPLDAIDPHAVGDVAAQLFGAAIADPLYAVDPNGRPYPALAAALPEPIKGGFRVAIRPNLLSALGRPMDARDVIWSLLRAEQRGA